MSVDLLNSSLGGLDQLDILSTPGRRRHRDVLSSAENKSSEKRDTHTPPSRDNKIFLSPNATPLWLSNDRWQTCSLGT